MTQPLSRTSRHTNVRRPLVIGVAYGMVVIATTGIIGATVLFATRDVLLGNERERLRASAKTAAAIVDADLIATITQPGQENTREYAAAVRPLFALDSADNSIVHIATAVVRGDSMRVGLDATSAGMRTADGSPAHHTLGEVLPAMPEAKLAWAAKT
ncbi:MAG TPA: hypothetical protein VGQ30_05800, partial [Gemmatimonadaceae bacterium]|nr:hypothetical protein [Gemmatimonadaceae bacterium]